MNTTALKNCTSAGERFFRLYQKHCVAPDADTLFNLLNSIHSLNDRLNKATGENFFEFNEFITLKALRNLFHHEGELVNKVRTVLATNLPSINSDLLFLCLIPSSLVVRSLNKIDNKRRVHEEPIVRATLKWYGTVVNINPCIFNFSVHVFEKLRALDVKLSEAEYADFEASYKFEEDNGHSHFVTGDISCHAGSIETVLAVVFADVT